MAIDDHTDQLETAVWLKEQARIIEAQRKYIDDLLELIESVALDHDLEEEIEAKLLEVNQRG